ncbi:MAG: hybrid sensor histidine kinase/response regulator [Myxococcota bacterium]
MSTGRNSSGLGHRGASWLSEHPLWFLLGFTLQTAALALVKAVFQPPVQPLIVSGFTLALMPILFRPWAHRVGLAIITIIALPLHLPSNPIPYGLLAQLLMLGFTVEAISWAVRDRARTFESLRQSETRYRRLVETSNVIPWEVELPSYCFTYVGPQAVPLLGHPIEAWYAEDFWTNHVHPDDREWTAAFCRTQTEQGLDHEFEYRMLAKDGGIRWIRDIVTVCKEDGPPRALRGVMIDVTEQHRLQEARLALEERSRRSERLESLGLLAGGIAHDFNNLLVAILGNADLALQEPSTSPAARGKLEEITAAAERASELTQQMLLYAGTGPAEMRTRDLSTLISESIPMLQTLVPKGVRLRVDPPREEVWVEADQGQIDRALIALVSNAVEAGAREVTVRAGGFEPPPGFHESCVIYDRDLEGPCAYVEVRDDGSGMSPAMLDSVFEPFFTTRVPGRGFGLAGVLGIARRHRGGIQAESAPGRGACIRLVLPRAAGPAVEPQAPPAARTPRSGGTVLFVDDEEAVQRVGRAALERAGFHVTSARDGVEALELLEKLGDQILGVVLDVVMPRLGGREILGWIGRERPDIPVVLSSGYDERAAELRGSSSPVRAYLPKPYLPSELVGCVRALQDESPAEPERAAS